MHRNQKGMTLVEVLAVVVLIGLIMAVVSKSVFKTSDKAKANLNKAKMEKVAQGLGMYRLENNTYPGSLDDLVRNGDLSTEDTKDIWGTPYTYRQEGSGRSFSLMSYGADGVAGGDGPNTDVTVNP